MRLKIAAWRLSLKRVRFEQAQVLPTPMLPVAVTVHPDGAAVAHFAGARDLWFCDLAHLLLGHGLALDDFDELPSEGDEAG